MHLKGLVNRLALSLLLVVTSSPGLARAVTPPKNPSPQAEKRDDKSRTVYITRTGKKYHASSCRYLSRSSIPITLSDAIRKRYSACSVCGGG